MFSGLVSDLMAVSHVWFGLPGGRFQSDGGLRFGLLVVVYCAVGLVALVNHVSWLNTNSYDTICVKRTSDV